MLPALLQLLRGQPIVKNPPCLQLTILKQAVFARKQRAIRNALIIGDQITRWALYATCNGLKLDNSA